MTNILIIAGEYPPLKTIGRIRTAKFVEHWHNAGHTPVVLTLDFSGKEPIYEKSLENEIPDDLKVFRVKNFHREDKIINFIKRILGRSIEESPTAPQQIEQTSKTSLDKKVHQKSKLGFTNSLIKAYKSFFRHWVDVPDDYVDWSNKSYSVALDIVERYDIQIIYTSFPPFSACKLGYRLKQSTNLPWVVDYRDLWTGDVLREWIPRLRAKYETYLEKKFVSKADAVISVSDQKTAFLSELLPKSGQSFHTVTNGYDSESFSSLLEVATSKVKSKHMNIVYCGRLFKNRKGYTFLNALGEVAKQSPELVNNLKVHYYGGIDIEIFEEYQRIISKYNLGNIVVCHGDVDFESSKKALVEADILLLIVDTGATSDGVIPGKLFEYVAAQKPIFALSDAAATNQIIINGKLGKVLPPNDLQKCKEGVFEILNNNKFVSDYKPDLDYIQQYDRKTLANRMIAIFEQCIEQNTKI